MHKFPKKIERKTGRKYGFIRSADIKEGLKAIEHINDKIVGDSKLQAIWARFQKRFPPRGRKESNSTPKKPGWK